MAKVNSQGITAIDPETPAPLSVLPGPSAEAISSCHLPVKRYFIGPLPISIASPQLRRSHRIFRPSTAGNPQDDDIDAELDDLSEERIWHILRHFVSERNLNVEARHALVGKLKTNPWFTLVLRKKHNFRTKWIGDSFEVGKDLLGSDILINEGSRALSRISSPQELSVQPESSAVSDLSILANSGDPASTCHIFVHSDAHTTPHTEPQIPQSESNGRSSDVESQPTRSDLSLLPHQTQYSPGGSQAIAGGESTPLGHQPKTTMLRSIFRRAVSSNAHLKTRTVNFVTHGDDQCRVEQGLSLSPTVPIAVLSSRHGHGEPRQLNTGAMGQNVEPPPGPFMRDRMLVKLSHSPSGSLPIPFDEDDARHHPRLDGKKWREFLVVWNGKDINLHENYSSQKNHPSYTISLVPSTTRLSLYSHCDMSFCLTCNPTSSNDPSISPFHRTFSGTDIYVFKCKTRSRGVDWIWLLWRELGGEIPTTLDVQVPTLGTRVTLDIPQHDVLGRPEGFKTLSQQYIVNICRNALSSLPEYASLVATEMEHGTSLGLAWRRQMQLDWVWLDRDVNGAPRDWSTLFGLAFKQSNVPVQLELRVASHSPTKAHFADGTELVEPPSIEGYLYRVKPTTQTGSNVYVASHSGNLFTMSPAHAFPPPIPQPPEDFANQAGEAPIPTRGREINRGAEQILHATGYVDIRDISLVRRASKTLAPQSHHTPTEGEIAGNYLQLSDDNDLLNISAENDPGGEAFLVHSAEAEGVSVKLGRSFELVMRSGGVIRFEAHKTSNALEWIKHLRALVRFWTRRHRVDARVETDLVHLSVGKPRFEVPRASVSRPQGHHVPSALPDPQAAAHLLSSFWTWCVLDVCGSVVKTGLLYVKYGPRKHFQHLCMVLIPGHIVLFHASSSKTGHHHHARTVSLIDSYVYSGLLAASDLPLLFDTTVPRRYKDGLETNDSDLDTTFVIRHHSHPLGWDKSGADDEKPIKPKAANATVPPLNSKHQLLIFKARSKLEREAWCWALNTEIERVVRATADREGRLRSGG